jgi:hypothetical protein
MIYILLSKYSENIRKKIATVAQVIQIQTMVIVARRKRKRRLRVVPELQRRQTSTNLIS